MQGLKWSDNVLSEGMTCIHGHFTLADMKQLLELCPEGSFTPTFPGLNSWNNEEMFADVVKQGLADKERGYYFNFLWKDAAALTMYLLHMGIEMEPEVKEKVARQQQMYWDRVMAGL